MLFTMYAPAHLLAASILSAILATQLAPSIFCSALTLGGSLKKGFQVTPSQISLQWGSFRPFLMSPGGSFSLGFEAVENGYVLAIMYTLGSSSNSNISVEPPLNMEMVWSANENSPSSEEAIFSLNQQGSLILSDASKGTIWSTGATNPEPTKLSLQDSGNLILSADTTGSNTPIMWQSFDHPTDTLLQGQNFTASMRLTSSLRPMSKNSSTSVFFKMEVDGIALYADMGQNASQLMYWKLDADQETAVIDSQNSSIYARMDAMGYLGMYQAENERVSYEVFDTYNSTDVSYRRLKLDADGNLRVYYWGNSTSWGIDFQAVSDELCALPSPCGPFGICNMSGACMCAAGGVISNNVSVGNASFARLNDSDASQGCVVVNATSLVDDGCERHAEVSSSDTSTAGKGLFMQLVGMDSLFHAKTRTPVNATSVQACEVLCRIDCTCTAFFYSKGSASKCFLAYQLAELSLVQTGNTDDLAFIKLSKATVGTEAVHSTLPTQMAKRGSRSVAGPVIWAIVGLLCVGVVFALAVWRYRARRLHGDGDLEKKAFLSEIPGLPAYVSYKEIEACSANFKRHRYAGALGSICEAVLADGARVAIARLSLLNKYDLHNLKLTLASVSSMTHPNLAKLCCYSIDGSNLALCYELPPNGWLDLASLSWKQRVDVGFGVARALAALHEGAKMQHGLLSLEAVFVTRTSEAKVAGLGLAELMAGRLAAPINSAQRPPDLADSADVLQFGVVLTELLTGQRVKDDAAVTWRLKWRDAINKKRLAQLLDPAILADATSAHGDLAARLATSAGLCLHPSPLQRPPMGTVIRILDGSHNNLPLI